MNKISFIFCVHNHQPVGNFEFVMEEGFAKAYRPFLDILKRHPYVRVVLHVSGSLLEWMEQHRPEYLDTVETLVSRGQLELLTGGFYEPILPSIPDDDKVGQIKKLSAFLRDRLGFDPSGMWLAERVWEPSLPSRMAEAGVKYTVVDDSHFKSAGLSEHELLGCFLTEDQGAVVRVFSGSKRLRYLIPFADPAETIRYLRQNASADERALLVFADDGEKFGIWPGTHELSYVQGWLEKFFAALEENREWLRVTTFEEYAGRHRPLGWVFLPTASYAEMMEWCLPVGAQLAYHSLLKKLGEEGDLGKYESFVKGGFWRNFLSRYPESNWMHKRMLEARRLVAAMLASGAPEDAFVRARNETCRAQCNCAYWHGVFGGLYLPHLREAVYRHIIRAENLALGAGTGGGGSARTGFLDVDGDGDSEVLLSAGSLTLFVRPSDGGTVVEIDHAQREINLLNTLARRREAYHARLEHGNPGRPAEKAASIHEAVLAKEKGLGRFLRFDRHPRVCLLDHFLPRSTSLTEMLEVTYAELGDFVSSPYAPELGPGGAAVTLRRAGQVGPPGGRLGVSIEKTLLLDSRVPSLAVEYALDWDRETCSGILFAPELNFHFPSGRRVRGFVCCGTSEARDFSLAEPREFQHVREVRATDEHLAFDTVLSSDAEFRLWQFPVETVSLSESGLERVYQATCLIPVWTLPADATHMRVNFTVALEDRGVGHG
ncbi:MAG: alpha-amylase/4-alpha-glucanotransferase domain-containing protein [Candidatus Eisenbacteria bacterium]